MLQGMFGQRVAEHFSLLESSSIVLGPNRDADREHQEAPVDRPVEKHRVGQG
jgi:hypothetical protein